MMSDVASSLRSARACLDMNVKSVASALRMSDRTLTQLERHADTSDPKVVELLEFYEELGLKFPREKGEITGILHSEEVRRLTISAARGPNPDQDIDSLRKAFRIINGLVYNLRRIDKTKSNIADTVDVHFPVSGRDFVKTILATWVDGRQGIEILEPNGEAHILTPDLVNKLL